MYVENPALNNYTGFYVTLLSHSSCIYCWITCTHDWHSRYQNAKTYFKDSFSRFLLNKSEYLFSFQQKKKLQMSKVSEDLCLSQITCIKGKMQTVTVNVYIKKSLALR